MYKKAPSNLLNLNFLLFLTSFFFLNLGISISYFFILIFFLYLLIFKNIYLETENKLALLLFSYFSLNFIFLFEYKDINLNFIIKELLYIKFFLLFYYINLNFKNLNSKIISSSFIKIFYITCILIVLVYLERFFGYNIFNREMDYGRTYGPYKELIVGTLILFFGYHGFLQILLNINNSINSKYLKNIFFIFLFNFYFFSIFCTGERMNFLLSILIIFFMLLLIKTKRVIILVSTFILLTLIFFSLTYNSSLKEKYTNFYKMLNFSKLSSHKIHSTIENNNNKKINKQEKDISNKKITNYHLVHWLTAYELWKKKPIFGWGTKSFRYKCDDLKNINYFTQDGRCNTHPHNIYLEILSETGIVGLLIIILFLNYNLKNIKEELIKAYKKSYNKEILILLLSLTLITLLLIWPIKTSGRLFSNFYGTIFWFNIFCLINLLKNLKKLKNEK